MELEKLKKIIEESFQQINLYHDINIDSYTALMSKILAILEEPKNLVNLTIAELKELKGTFISEKDNKYLNTYKLVLENPYLSFSTESENILVNICNNILKRYKEIKALKENSEKINELYNRFIDNIHINSSDLDTIYGLLKSCGLPLEEIRDIIFELSKVIYNNLEPEITKELQEEDDDISVGIEISECETLFREYGYDFSEFSEENQKILLNKGNYSNIKDIFEILKGQVDLHDNNGNLIQKKQDCLCTILINSNKKIVEKIIEVCEKNNLYILNSKGEKVIDFYTMIKEPSKFLLRKKNYYSHYVNDGESSSIDIQEVGSFQDFIENIELFKQKAYETFGRDDYIIKIFQKSNGDIFNYPHKRILNVMKIFEMYDYFPQYYLESPSCFNSIRQADILDLAIELDFMDYLKENPSILMYKSNSPLFYKISMARSLNYNNMYRVLNKKGIFGERKKIELNGKGIEDYLNLRNIKVPCECNLALTPTGKFAVYEEYVSRDIANSIDLVQNELMNENSKCNIKLLEENFRVDNNPLVYRIDDLIFSRLKVLRIYNVLLEKGIEDNIDTLLYAVTRGSHISIEDYKCVETKLKELFVKGRHV